MEINGTCEGCQSYNTGYEYCQSCQAKIFQEKFPEWSSGNNDIDEIIRSSQLNAKKEYEAMKWIPFSNFNNYKKICQGNFGVLYRAETLEGRFLRWNIKTKVAERNNELRVVLKSRLTLQDLLSEVCL